MALAKCPECNKEISEHAVVCPSCGHPLNIKFNTIEEFFRKYKLQIFFGAITVIGFISLSDRVETAQMLSKLFIPWSIAYPLATEGPLTWMTLLGLGGFIVSTFFINKKK